jgi:hypothetical protein
MSYDNAPDIADAQAAYFKSAFIKSDAYDGQNFPALATILISPLLIQLKFLNKTL